MAGRSYRVYEVDGDSTGAIDGADVYHRAGRIWVRPAMGGSAQFDEAGAERLIAALHAALDDLRAARVAAANPATPARPAAQAWPRRLGEPIEWPQSPPVPEAESR